MVVIALYRRCWLLEADVIETSKGSTADVFDGVIWDKELLLHAKHRLGLEMLVKHPHTHPKPALPDRALAPLTQRHSWLSIPRARGSPEQSPACSFPTWHYLNLQGSSNQEEKQL